MKFTAHVALMVVVAVSVVSGQTIKPGRCPKFTPKPDFDAARYLGIWYEIEKFPTTFTEGQRCIYAEYTDRGDGTIGVHDAGYDKYDSLLEIYGYAELAEVPGRLVIYLDGVPTTGDYNVLDTDYETFSSVYSCQNMIGFHIELAWILGRSRFFTEEQRAQAIEPFTRFGINSSEFVATPQGNCTIP